MTSQQYRLEKYGKSLIGKTAQCQILTEISAKGTRVFQASQMITGYEIVEEFQEPALMVIIGGESVFEDLLFNISK